ncbi:MAG: DNA recombination protein RmuC [Candidatus Izemoplasma sp.]|nr:DNA recombination protein RmuC [Candidatus Izemoplasma sp.]
MDYIILGLLIITIILLALAILMITKNTQQDVTSTIKDQNNILLNKIIRENGEIKVELANSIGKSSKENIKDLNTFKEGLTEDITKRFNRLNDQIENKMDNINKKVEIRLSEGFEKTNKTFTNIVERLSKIDEAQKNIDKLSTEVVSLQNILTDKKTRGTFGEVQLNHILESIFGEKNTKVFDTQVTLSNGKKVDALIHLPEQMGNLAIDSKFPLENYQRMVDKDASNRAKELATRGFKKDVKKHIDDIATKYIIPTETSEQAILFVPAEAIFAEINAYHQDLVDYAQRKRVWIASPTTLMSLLTTVQMMLRNAERDKHAKVIQEELIKLGDEFKRYQERWDKLSRTIDTVNKDVKNIHITSNKIGKKFSAISNVNIETNQKIDSDND